MQTLSRGRRLSADRVGQYAAPLEPRSWSLSAPATNWAAAATMCAHSAAGAVVTMYHAREPGAAGAFDAQQELAPYGQ
jgi:hypothetical protein